MEGKMAKAIFRQVRQTKKMPNSKSPKWRRQNINIITKMAKTKYKYN
jgi:hypothetical protein